MIQQNPGTRRPKVWALLGARRGDNNQVLALAEALGVPFETKSLRYNGWRHLQPKLLGATLCSLARSSRRLVEGDPPDLTISTGHRSVPVVQAIRQRSKGRTRSVHIGYPRISPDRFDLVVATPEYPISDHPNLFRIPLALSPGSTVHPVDDRDNSLIEQFAQPRRLLVLGGHSLYWTLESRDVVQALSTLLDRAAADGGSVLVVGSPRTPARMLRAVGGELASASCAAMLVPINGPPSYRSLLQSADQIFVTADSVAMVSEAVRTGKPVGFVPIRQTLTGRAYMKLMDWIRPGMRVHPRDLRFFWKSLEEKQLAGTVQQPRQGEVPESIAEITERVLRLIG